MFAARYAPGERLRGVAGRLLRRHGTAGARLAAAAISTSARSGRDIVSTRDFAVLHDNFSDWPEHLENADVQPLIDAALRACARGDHDALRHADYHMRGRSLPKYVRAREVVDLVPLLDAAISTALRGEYDRCNPIMGCCRGFKQYGQACQQANVPTLLRALVGREPQGATSQTARNRAEIGKFLSHFWNWTEGERVVAFVPELIVLLRDQDESIASFAASGLAAAGTPVAKAKLLEELAWSVNPGIIDVVCRNPDTDAAVQMCLCLQRVDAEIERLNRQWDAEPRLSRSHMPPTGRLRAAAEKLIATVALLKNRGAINTLAPLLSSSLFGSAVLSALAQIDDRWQDTEGTTPHIIHAFRTSFVSEVKHAALAILQSGQGGAAVTRALIDELHRGGQRAFRWAAGTALKSLTSVPLLEPVASALHDGTFGEGMSMSISLGPGQKEETWRLDLGQAEAIVYYTHKDIADQSELSELIEQGLRMEGYASDLAHYNLTFQRELEPKLNRLRELLVAAALNTT